MTERAEHTAGRKSESVSVEELARFIERDFDYDHPVRRFVSTSEWGGLARALLARYSITKRTER
jgi:hypothetical protein